MDYMMELALNEQDEQYQEFLQMKADDEAQKREDRLEEIADERYNYLKEEGLI